MKKAVVLVILMAAIGLPACDGSAGNNPAPAGEVDAVPAQSGESAAVQSQEDASDDSAGQSRDASSAALPFDGKGSYRDQVTALLHFEHEAFLSGDEEAYCAAHTQALTESWNGCGFIHGALEFQRKWDNVLEEIEILEITKGGEEIYASAYTLAEGARYDKPTDFQIVREGPGWRISMTRLRTEAEPGPAKCFVGGSFNDLC